MKALIHGNRVCQIESEEFPVHPSMVWVDCPDEATTQWQYKDGQVQPPDLPEPPTPEEIQRNLTAALDQHIDSVAQAKGYDNRITASLRAAAPNSPWHAEGVAFIEWMDTCYDTGQIIMNEVMAGTRAIPTVEELLAGMPEMVWPTT
jgi:hypothetical protein